MAELTSAERRSIRECGIIVVDAGPLMSILVLKYAFSREPNAARSIIHKSRVALTIVELSPQRRTPPRSTAAWFETSSSTIDALVHRRGLLVSTLNFAISGAFARHQIVFPYPQRDIHIRSGAIEIKSESKPAGH